MILCTTKHQSEEDGGDGLEIGARIRIKVLTASDVSLLICSVTYSINLLIKQVTIASLPLTYERVSAVLNNFFADICRDYCQTNIKVHFDINWPSNCYESETRGNTACVLYELVF